MIVKTLEYDTTRIYVIGKEIYVKNTFTGPKFTTYIDEIIIDGVPNIFGWVKKPPSRENPELEIEICLDNFLDYNIKKV